MCSQADFVIVAACTTITTMLHSQWAHVAATFIVSVIVAVGRQLYKCVCLHVHMYVCVDMNVYVFACDSSVAQFVAALHKKLTIELTRAFSVHDCLVACHMQATVPSPLLHTHTQSLSYHADECMQMQRCQFSFTALYSIVCEINQSST